MILCYKRIIYHTYLEGLGAFLFLGILSQKSSIVQVNQQFELRLRDLRSYQHYQVKLLKVYSYIYCLIMSHHYFTNKKTLSYTEPPSSPHIASEDDKPFNISNRLQHLQQQLNNITIDHDHSMLQVNHLIDKATQQISQMDVGKARTFYIKLKSVEYRLGLMVQSERDEMLEQRVALKRFVQENGKVLEQIIKCEAQEESQIHRQIEHIIAMKMKQLKELIDKQQEISRKTATQLSSTKNKTRPDWKQRMKDGLEELENQLGFNRSKKQQTIKQTNKMLRAYQSVLALIEEGRQDRQTKQQQLLFKVQDIGNADRTKQQTLSRIQ